MNRQNSNDSAELSADEHHGLCLCYECQHRLPPDCFQSYTDNDYHALYENCLKATAERDAARADAEALRAQVRRLSAALDAMETLVYRLCDDELPGYASGVVVEARAALAAITRPA